MNLNCLYGEPYWSVRWTLFVYVVNLTGLNGEPYQSEQWILPVCMVNFTTLYGESKGTLPAWTVNASANCPNQEEEPTIMDALAFCIILSTEF